MSKMAKTKIKKEKKKDIAARAKSAQKGTSTYLYAVLAITAILFLNTLQHGFVNWDDPVNILENPNLNGFNFENIKGIFTSTVIGNYNPLPIFMFAVEKAIFGLEPLVFHFNNVLLHLVCVFLVYKFLIKLKLSPLAAAFGALLFGIHPMRVESVAWITERKDVLFGAFYLGALLTYIKSLEKPKQAKKWLSWTFGLFVLSSLSKIQAVSLPLSMLAIDYYFKRPLKFTLIIEKIPFFIISIITGLVGIYFLGSDGSLEDATNYTNLERLLIGAYSYCVYLIKWILPYEMSPLYPYEKEIPTLAYVAPLGVLATIGAFYWAFIKEKRAIVFAISFFTFNVMFMLQVVGAGQGFIADRFTYIPYLGLFFLMAFYLEKLLAKQAKNRTAIFAGIGAYMILMSFMTFNQNKIWENGETLWTHASKCYPETFTPYQNRGKYYQSVGQIDKAEADFTKSIATATDKDVPYNSRGKLYFDKGQNDKALADFNNAVLAGTDLAEIYINRGSALAQSGNLQAALPDFTKGIELDPTFKQGFLMRSLLYYSTQQYDLAANDMKEAVKLTPNSDKNHFECGNYLNLANKPQEAITYLTRAIELNNTNPQYYRERSNSYLKLGDIEAAQQDQNSAKRLGG